MNVRELLEEPNFDEDVVNALVKQIQEECGTALKACMAAKNVIYRGVQDITVKKDFAVIPIRKDRLPVEMPERSHELLAQVFTDMGFKTTRKNSIFCTTMGTVAEDWGKLCVVFPKDGWHALVFDELQDDYSFYNLKTASMTEKPDHVRSVVEKLGAREFVDAASLATVIKKRYHEVLISGSSYIAIRLAFWDEHKMAQKLGIKK